MYSIVTANENYIRFFSFLVGAHGYAKTFSLGGRDCERYYLVITFIYVRQPCIAIVLVIHNGHAEIVEGSVGGRNLVLFTLCQCYSIFVCHALVFFQWSSLVVFCLLHIPSSSLECFASLSATVSFSLLVHFHYIFLSYQIIGDAYMYLLSCFYDVFVPIIELCHPSRRTKVTTLRSTVVTNFGCF